jgi:hypothetical protein
LQIIRQGEKKIKLELLISFALPSRQQAPAKYYEIMYTLKSGLHPDKRY